MNSKNLLISLLLASAIITTQTMNNDQELARALQLSFHLEEQTVQEQEEKDFLAAINLQLQEQQDREYAQTLQNNNSSELNTLHRLLKLLQLINQNEAPTITTINTRTNNNHHQDEDADLKRALLLSLQEQNNKTTQTNNQQTTEKTETVTNNTSEKTEECPICLEDKTMKELQILTCMHKLCHSCYNECFAKKTLNYGDFSTSVLDNKKCPVCRTPF